MSSDRLARLWGEVAPEVSLQDELEDAADRRRGHGQDAHHRWFWLDRLKGRAP